MPEPLTFESREVRAQFMEASIPEQTRRDLAVCEAMDRLDVTVESMRQMVDLVLSVRRSIDEGTDRDQILLRWSASNELLRDSYETLRTRARTASDAFRAALGLWPNPPTNKSPRHTLAGAFFLPTSR